MKRCLTLALSFVAALAAFLCTSSNAQAQDCTPPRILLIMDTSTSMGDTIDDGNGGTIAKWAAAQQAISSVLGNYPDNAQYGLMLFPGVAAGCAAGEVVVDVASGTAATIDQTVSAYAIQNGAYTPAGQSLMMASMYSGITDPGYPNYVIFVTDGHQWCEVGDPNNPTCASQADCNLMGVSPCPTCSSNQPDGCYCVRTWPVIGTQALADAGVTTYVVGFGESVNARYLNEAAYVGGAALPGCIPDSPDPSCYFQATVASELNAALGQILLQLVSESCVGDCDITGNRICTANGWTDCDAPTSVQCTSSCNTPGTQECINNQLTECSSEAACGSGGSGTGASGAGTPTGGSGTGGTGFGGNPLGDGEDPDDDGDCGCRTVGHPQGLAGFGLLLGLAGLTRLRRRRGPR